MAVSFRIIVFLVALAVFGGAYAIIDKPVDDPVDPQADSLSDSQPAQNYLSIVREVWRLLPFFTAIACCGWLVKEAIYVRGYG